MRVSVLATLLGMFHLCCLVESTSPRSGINTLPLEISPSLAAELDVATLSEGNVESQAQSIQSRDLNDVLLSFFENLRDKMKTGSSLLGIPRLDPYLLMEKAIDVDVPQLKLSGNVADLNVTGLASFIVGRLAASLVPVAANASFRLPALAAVGNYDLKGEIPISSIGSLPFYGKGPITARVEGLEVNVFFVMGLTNEGRINLQELDLSWNISSVRVHLGGLLGGQEMGAMINDMLTDSLPHLVQLYRERMTASFLKVAKKELNSFLLGLHVDSPLEDEDVLPGQEGAETDDMTGAATSSRNDKEDIQRPDLSPAFRVAALALNVDKRQDLKSTKDDKINFNIDVLGNDHLLDISKKFSFKLDGEADYLPHGTL